MRVGVLRDRSARRSYEMGLRQYAAQVGCMPQSPSRPALLWRLGQHTHALACVCWDMLFAVRLGALQRWLMRCHCQLARWSGLLLSLAADTADTEDTMEEEE